MKQREKEVGQGEVSFGKLSDMGVYFQIKGKELMIIERMKILKKKE